eukprot:348696-Prorocentrum_minimum.AAC.2
MIAGDLATICRLLQQTPESLCPNAKPFNLSHPKTRYTQYAHLCSGAASAEANYPEAASKAGSGWVTTTADEWDEAQTRLRAGGGMGEGPSDDPVDDPGVGPGVGPGDGLGDGPGEALDEGGAVLSFHNTTIDDAIEELDIDALLAETEGG